MPVGSDPPVASVTAVVASRFPLARSGKYFFFCSSVPNFKMGSMPSANTWSIMAVATETRLISSTAIMRSTYPNPSPPNCSGMVMAIISASASPLTTSVLTSPVSSISDTRGATTVSANSAAAFLNISCSSVNVKSIIFCLLDGYWKAFFIRFWFQASPADFYNVSEQFAEPKSAGNSLNLSSKPMRRTGRFAAAPKKSVPTYMRPNIILINGQKAFLK